MKIFLADEIARILRVSKGRVYELARQGRLPAVRIGRQVRFREETVEAWLVALEGGRAVIQSVPDGSIGYENRPGGLWDRA